MTAIDHAYPDRQHRVYVSTASTGYAASCATCGWRLTRSSREARQHAIDQHHTAVAEETDSCPDS